MAQSQKEVSYHIPHGWKYGYRAQICDSIMSGFEVMGYLVIWGRGSRHLGFKKMPPGEILHTLQKLSSQTLMNTYQSKKTLYTPFPPSTSYGHISSWLQGKGGLQCKDTKLANTKSCSNMEVMCNKFNKFILRYYINVNKLSSSSKYNNFHIIFIIKTLS